MQATRERADSHCGEEKVRRVEDECGSIEAGGITRRPGAEKGGSRQRANPGTSTDFGTGTPSTRECCWTPTFCYSL